MIRAFFPSANMPCDLFLEDSSFNDLMLKYVNGYLDKGNLHLTIAVEISNSLMQLLSETSHDHNLWRTGYLTCPQSLSNSRNNLWQSLVADLQSTTWGYFQHLNITRNMCVCVKWRLFWIGLDSEHLISNYICYGKGPIKLNIFTRDLFFSNSSTDGFCSLKGLHWAALLFHFICFVLTRFFIWKGVPCLPGSICHYFEKKNHKQPEVKIVSSKSTSCSI